MTKQQAEKKTVKFETEVSKLLDIKEHVIKHAPHPKAMMISTYREDDGFSYELPLRANADYFVLGTTTRDGVDYLRVRDPYGRNNKAIEARDGVIEIPVSKITSYIDRVDVYRIPAEN